jgi:hypothetical protein
VLALLKLLLRHVLLGATVADYMFCLVLLSMTTCTACSDVAGYMPVSVALSLAHGFLSANVAGYMHCGVNWLVT